MATTSNIAPSASAAPPLSLKNAKIAIDGLNVMRQEQRAISNRLISLEADVNEHRLVLDALKQVDEERKAFRLVGGVLIEQKVKDVIPDLQTNIEKMMSAAESSEARMKEKGAQIQEYVKEHNLASLLRPGAVPVAAPSAAPNAEEGKPATSSSSSSSSTAAAAGSVLV
ncbi:Prefoldin subunit 2 [Tyrophagus putrescentiae]|nr:Prefoldin subunit 2 [Tyrophagus putrescentiae]